MPVGKADTSLRNRQWHKGEAFTGENMVSPARLFVKVVVRSVQANG